MVFIDLQKVYDRFPREVLWRELKKKRDFHGVCKNNIGRV